MKKLNLLLVGMLVVVLVFGGCNSKTQEVVEGDKSSDVSVVYDKDGNIICELDLGRNDGKEISKDVMAEYSMEFKNKTSLSGELGDYVDIEFDDVGNIISPSNPQYEIEFNTGESTLPGKQEDYFDLNFSDIRIRENRQTSKFRERLDIQKSVNLDLLKKNNKDSE